MNTNTTATTQTDTQERTMTNLTDTLTDIARAEYRYRYWNNILNTLYGTANEGEDDHEVQCADNAIDALTPITDALEARIDRLTRRATLGHGLNDYFVHTIARDCAIHIETRKPRPGAVAATHPDDVDHDDDIADELHHIIAYKLNK